MSEAKHVTHARAAIVPCVSCGKLSRVDLARIEDKARHELGMVAPGKDQVQLAREFVAAGGGVSRAVPSRTAAADRGTPGDRTLRR